MSVRATIIRIIRCNLPMLDVQWNMCIMDTLGPAKKCPDYQGVLIFLVILSYKMTFGTSTKCLDYAGILKCPH